MKTFLGFFYSLPGYLYSRRHLISIWIKSFLLVCLIQNLGISGLGSYYRRVISSCFVSSYSTSDLVTWHSSDTVTLY